jgi:hypothetical protein
MKINITKNSKATRFLIIIPHFQYELTWHTTLDRFDNLSKNHAPNFGHRIRVACGKPKRR